MSSNNNIVVITTHNKDATTILNKLGSLSMRDATSPPFYTIVEYGSNVVHLYYIHDETTLHQAVCLIPDKKQYIIGYLCNNITRFTDGANIINTVNGYAAYTYSLNRFLEDIESIEPSHVDTKCTCDIMVLMAYGCQCGAFNKEQELTDD